MVKHKLFIMKKLAILALAISVFACNEKEEKPKDYVTLSGTITNKNSDSVFVKKKDFIKVLKVAEDGTFKDTLKVAEPGVFSIGDGTEVTSIFLKNGYDLNMTIDTKMFDETVKYTGEGSETSNFLAAHSLKQETYFSTEAYKDLDSLAYNKEFDKVENELKAFYDNAKNIDSTVVADAKERLPKIMKYYRFAIKQQLETEKAMSETLYKGADSPEFKDYENYAGGTMSLNDLKGKYTYIDIWATWCGPCKAEIPSLKKIEAAYHGKNIQFVSISIDDDRTHGNSWDKAKEDWKAMVADKELGGIQLFAPKGWQSQFIADYYIMGIPRFILLDPDGKIVSADAPRPSSSDLTDLFSELNI